MNINYGKFSFKIHKEGYNFIILFFAASVLFWLTKTELGVIGFLLTAWCIYFFRDPERVTPQDKNSVISIGDGLITKIERITLPAELSLGAQEVNRVSVFLSVFDVHVNRIPIAGKIIKIFYYPGKFFNATLDKSSSENERNHLAIQTTNGDLIVCTQIAGLIARRIVCDTKEEMDVCAGERFGIIRFGSRVDLYLPLHYEIKVLEGQRAISGETVIATRRDDVVTAIS